MDNLYKNKKAIIICLILLIITFSIYFFSNKKEISTEDTGDYKFLKNYKSNEFIPVRVTEEDIVEKYLNEYKNNMLFNIEEAYNSLNKEYREKRFTNIEGYKEYVNDILSLSTYSMEVDKYSVSSISGKKVFNIYDKSGNQYIIKEISIMNYEIYLDEYTTNIK